MSDNPLQVRELNHLAIYPRDLQVAAHFYEHILGLPRLISPDFPFPVVWFALGNQELHLLTDTAHLEDERHSVHFALRVDDAYAAHEALVSHGIPIHGGPAPRPDGAVQVFFHDPDGYLIEMVSFPE